MNETSSTLLLVDDEPNILAALRRLFRGAPQRVLTAGGGAEALEILAREPVDLIISDMQMPDMNGAQLLEEVRQRWPQVVRILLTGHSDMAATIAAINRGEIYRYIAKPWNDDELRLIVRYALERKYLEAENARLQALTRQQNEELKALNAGLEQTVAERTAQLRAALASLEQANKDLKREFLTSVMVFSGLIELRGGRHGERLTGHGRRVANMARGLAVRLGLDAGAVQDVMLAGLLHDIGKIGYPDDILDKPYNKLSPAERSVARRHPTIGQNALMAVDELKQAALLIQHHHEYIDGSGYPDGLAGDAIPFGARILAVVNDYDALLSGLLQAQALKTEDALAFLVSNRGKRYDGAVVDALVSWLAEKREEAIPGIPLHTGDLQPGMVLAGDLLHREGFLLLAAGHALDAHLIERLAQLEDFDQHPLTLHIRAESIPAAPAD